MKRTLVGGMYKMITIHECRRKQLLRYFGESTSNVECGKCDVCQSSGRELYDAGQQAYIVLKTIEETGNRYGKGFVRAILIGKPGEFQERISRVYGERLERAPEVYGKGANVPMTWWNPFIEYLLNNQMLIKEGREYPILRLARKGEEFLSAYENVPGAWDAVRDNEPSPPGTPTFCYPEEPVVKGKKPVKKPAKKATRTKANSALDRVKMILSKKSGEKIPLLVKNNLLKATPAVYFDGEHLVTRTMDENSR